MYPVPYIYTIHALYTIHCRLLTIFSLSPLYLEPKVEADTLKKVVLHSEATALASIVLPVPGGPVYRERELGTGWVRYERGIRSVCAIRFRDINT